MSTELFYGDGTRFDGQIIGWSDLPQPQEEEHAPMYMYRALYDASGVYVKNVPCWLYMRRGDRLYDDELQSCTFQAGYNCLGRGFEEADVPEDPENPDAILWICYPQRDHDGSMMATGDSGLVFICREGELAPFIQL